MPRYIISSLFTIYTRKLSNFDIYLIKTAKQIEEFYIFDGIYLVYKANYLNKMFALKKIIAHTNLLFTTGNSSQKCCTPFKHSNVWKQHLYTSVYTYFYLYKHDNKFVLSLYDKSFCYRFSYKKSHFFQHVL